MESIYLLVIFSLCAINSVKSDFLLGDYASIKEFPYMVDIKVIDESHRCGGALISPEFVITSAQCIKGISPDKLTIRVGRTNVMDQGDTYTASEVYIHHEYKTRHNIPINDLALVEVESIVLSRNVQPIKLLKYGYEVRRANVSGWRAGSFFRRHLRWKQVPIKDLRWCNETRYERRLVRGQICAGLGDRRITNCYENVGDPLVSFGHLVGVLSIPASCERPIKPEVYSSIPLYYDWIQSILHPKINSHESIPSHKEKKRPKEKTTQSSIKIQPPEEESTPRMIPITKNPAPVEALTSPKPVPVKVSTSPKPVPVKVLTSPKPVLVEVSTSPKPVSVEVSTSPKPVPVEVSTSLKPVPVEVSTSPEPVPVEVSANPKPVTVEETTSEKLDEASTSSSPADAGMPTTVKPSDSEVASSAKLPNTEVPTTVTSAGAGESETTIAASNESN